MGGEAKKGRARWLGLLTALLCLLLVGAAEAEAPGAEYSVTGGVGSVATAPDGTVWFVASEGLGRIGTDGKLEAVKLSGHEGYLNGLIVGSDGNLWAASSGAVERITPAGEVTRLTLPKELGSPSTLVADPAGGVWFASWRRRRQVPDWERWTGPAYVGRIAPDGQLQRFELPGEEGARDRAPGGIALGPDGNLWVTDPALGRIDRISPVGQIDSFPLSSAPWGIAAGSDGALWFTANAEIGRITTAGKVTHFPLRGSGRFNIVAGPDGNLWFGGGGLSVGRITPWGQVSWFGISGGVATTGLAAGTDGIWVGTAANPIKFIVDGSLSKLATGLPGIEIVSTKVTVRDGRVGVELACGGSPARGCTGELRLGPERDPVAEAAYSVPPESRRTIQLQLTPIARRQLSRQRFQRQHLVAGVEGGAWIGGDLVLRVPRPLRGKLPPRRLVEIPLPSGFETSGLARGLGGDLWYAESWGNRINRIGPSGGLTSYRLPRPESQPQAVTPGPRRSMWFLSEGLRGGRRYVALGRLSAAGGFSEFPLPGEGYGSDLVAGPDGNLWAARTGLREGEIDRVTPRGRVTRFPVREPDAIVSGPGGLWFTAESLAIGRITLKGKMTRFRVPGGGFLDGLAAGPDGNVWFTHWGRKGPPTVGRITPRGRIAEFPIHRHGHRGSTPGSIVAGPDGNLWFGEAGPARIGRITPRGRITHFTLPKGTTGPGALAVGADGNLWFTQRPAEEVGVFGLPGRGSACPASASGSC